MNLLPTNILATRSVATANNKAVITVTTDTNSELSGIRKALQLFLKDSLNITEVFYHIISPVDNDTLKVICIKFAGNDNPKIVWATNKISDEDLNELRGMKPKSKKEGVLDYGKSKKVDIIDFGIDDLSLLISGLSLSEGFFVNKDDEECSEKPTMLLAGFNDYGAVNIQYITSNDPLLATIYKADSGCEYYNSDNYSLKKTHSLLAKLDKAEKANEDFSVIQQYSRPNTDDVYIKSGVDDSDRETLELNELLLSNDRVKNSIILSPEFIEAHKSVTKRILGFEVRKLTDLGIQPTVLIKHGSIGILNKVSSNNENTDYDNNLYEKPSLSLTGDDIAAFVIEVNNTNDEWVQREIVEAVNNHFFSRSGSMVEELSTDELITNAFKNVQIHHSVGGMETRFSTQASYNAGLPLFSVIKKKNGSVIFEAAICKSISKKGKVGYSLLTGVNGITTDIYINKSLGLLFHRLMNIMQKTVPEYSNNSKLEKDVTDLFKTMQYKNFGIIHAEDLLDNK